MRHGPATRCHDSSATEMYGGWQFADVRSQTQEDSRISPSGQSTGVVPGLRRL